MSEEPGSQGAGADQIDIPAFGALAREHLAKGELDAARQACLEGFAENPRWVEGALIYLEVLGKLGEVSSAREVYARAITYEPLSAELRLAFAAVLEHERYPREAQRLACEAADLPAPHPPYDALLARLKALTPVEHPIADLGLSTPRSKAAEPRQDRTTPQTLAPTPEEPQPPPTTRASRGKRSRTAELPKRLSQGFEPVTTAAEAARAQRRPRWPVFVAIGALIAGLTAALVLLWLAGTPPLADLGPTQPAINASAEPPRPRPASTSTTRLALTPRPVSAPAPRPALALAPKPAPALKPALEPVVVKPTTPTSRPESGLTTKPVFTPPRRFRRRDPRRLLSRAIEAAKAGKRHLAIHVGHLALARLRRRRALKRSTSRMLIELGRLLRRGPHGARARAKDFLHEVARRPNAPFEAFFELGRVYRSLGDRPRAVWCFRRATRKAPTRAEAYFELGRALWGRRSWRGMARRALRRFVKLAPEHPKVPWAKRKLSG